MRKEIVRFDTIDVPATANVQGIPIGQGACTAVRLMLPIFVRDTATEVQVAQANRVVYYGDKSGQSMELTAILTKENITPKLPCTDLQDIYIRCNGTRVTVLVFVYSEIEDEFIS